MRKIAVLIVAFLFMGCSMVQVKTNEDTILQATATVAGYKVGVANPVLIPVINAQIDALLAFDPASKQNIVDLAMKGSSLLIQAIPDPAEKIIVQTLINSLQLPATNATVPNDPVLTAKIKMVLSAFKTGLQMSLTQGK